MDVGNRPGVPTLSLVNGDGPTLRLSALDDNWEGSLATGEIANTFAGPLVGIASGPGDFTVEGAFLNVTSIDSLGNGFLATYRPGTRPQVATTRFLKGVVATSSAFMALGVVDDAFAIRVYTSTSTHVIIDVTGVSVTGVPGPAAPAALKRQAVRRGSAAVRPQRLARRRAAR